MSQNLTELLELLVDEFYGEVASSVFAILALYGRLSMPGLLQYSTLPTRVLKAGLVTLIQQHLAYHQRGGDGLTYYQVNLEGAYALARSGKALDIIEQRFGQAGEEIARTLMSEGHATLPDLAEAYGLKDPDQDPDGSHTYVNGDRAAHDTNGQGHDRHNAGRQIHSFDQLRNLLERMKKAGYVTAVTMRSFVAPVDLEAEAGSLARSSLPITKAPNGKKQREEFSRAVNSLKRSWRDCESDNNISEDEDQAPAMKRLKTNGHTNGANGVHGRYGAKQKDQLVLKLNFEKINVMLRVRLLTDLAARYVSETSSKVYQALLEAMADRQPRCFDDIQGLDADADSDDDDDPDDKIYNPTIAAIELLDKLPEDIDISRGIATRGRPNLNGTNGTLEHGVENGTNGLHDDWDDDDDFTADLTTRRDHDDKHRLQQVARHLEILANSTIKFCRRVGSVGAGQYKVNFPYMCSKLIQIDIEDAVTSRFGNEAARLIRILDAKGKLDDRQLGVLSLQRVKDVKILLLELQTAGYLDLQEVPRDAGRAPSRTLYLYFYDRDRVRRKLLDDSYKIMSRLLQRDRVERERVRWVIDKAERTDVQGNEEKYLSNGELQELRMWQEKEEKLLLGVSRCDDVTAALRDFLPEGDSA